MREPAVSDRSAWVEQWCSTCHAAPGARCQRSRWASGRGNAAAQLHVARGWLARSCPTCKAPPGEHCSTPTGRPASQVHTARLRPGRWELVSRAAVWDELERRCVSVATVPFTGRAGWGGEIDVIRLQRVRDGEPCESRLWSGGDELANALAAPVWARFGTFVGHPLVRAEAIWTVERRSVVIVGRHGDRPFEEIVE
jgi:hypothetical protein